MSFFRPVCTILLLSKLIFLAIPGISQTLSVQTTQDSASHATDSLQDLKISQVGKELQLLKDNWEAYQKQKEVESDSLWQINNAIKSDLDRLDQENKNLEDNVKNLHRKLNLSISSIEGYKMKLATIMWVSGLVIFILILTIFLILVLKNRKMKHLITEQIEGLTIYTKSEFRQIRKDLREERRQEIKEIRKGVINKVKGEINKIRKGEIKEISKRVRKEIRKKLREEMKEEIKKRVPKFRKKGRK